MSDSLCADPGCEERASFQGVLCLSHQILLPVKTRIALWGNRAPSQARQRRLQFRASRLMFVGLLLYWEGNCSSKRL